MRRWIAFAVVVLLPLVGNGCGAGQGAQDALPGFTGGWFGPVGMSTQTGGLMGPMMMMGLGTAGVVFGPDGAIQQIAINGTPLGVTGQVDISSPSAGQRTYAFTRSDGVTGTIIHSPGGRHAVFFDSNSLFGALEKGASTLNAPYSLLDIQGTNWNGNATGLTATAGINGAATLTDAHVGPLGPLPANNITYTDSNNYMAMTGAMPMATVSTTHGGYSGAFMDSAMNTGAIHMLITPDRQFVGIHHSWGMTNDIANSRLVAWERAP